MEDLVIGVVKIRTVKSGIPKYVTLVSTLEYALSRTVDSFMVILLLEVIAMLMLLPGTVTKHMQQLHPTPIVMGSMMMK